MPSPIAFGATSARSWGWSGRTGPIVGTFGVFAFGQVGTSTNTTARIRYIFACNTNSFAASASLPSDEGSAAGNSTRGIFALGCVTICGSPGVTSTRNKYTYATNVNGTATSASSASYIGSAAGNATRGIFALGVVGGSSSTQRNKYTYACDANATATASSAISSGGAAAGTSTIGIFSLGASATTRNKYTYSTDVNGTATAASVGSNYLSAAGNSTRGIFAIGFAACAGTTTRNKYTYACDANATAAVASAQSYGGAAAGNATRGIFALGLVRNPCTGVHARSTTRNIYTYASDTSGVATAACTASSWLSAASNGTCGVNI